jgi:hypothetical protein
MDDPNKFKCLHVWKEYQHAERRAKAQGLSVQEYLKRGVEATEGDPHRRWQQAWHLSQFPEGALPPIHLYERLLSWALVALAILGPIALVAGLTALALFD